ncbi:organic hydroperoxide resistance protein [Patiriisocius marinistellae]|uniref:Organic hydroperoxide resistance protein n=1 Tax=Patiriisocius marinistellae TaxID=2494560 RepID=A0A5J4G2J6_9FLAO|nr:organic hydroperoxide resistance protein [Patiriisocius marinistellae]GEQ86835.1 organic hydroperoxide resistance protein [Patiriisocius marinistellae]
MKKLYEATSTAVGGRKGHVKSEDGPIDLNLSVPKGMGGDGGDGTNPEQLFGSAYAACFGGALGLIASKHDVKLDGDIEVSATISIHKTDKGNLQLAAVLDCVLPGVDTEKGEELINEAHEVCPFSRATRDNIDVTLNLMVLE